MSLGRTPRRSSRARAAACVAAVAMALAGACAPTPSPSPSATPSPIAEPTLPRGGSLRLVMPLNDETADYAVAPLPLDFMDPQKDFHFGNYELWRCCLARTLLSHNGRSVEEGGARLHPDLAKDMPEVSSDGLTWTFHLKEGLSYGPPLTDVEITAQDLVRSFHRLLAPNVSGAWFDFGDIEGAAEYNAGSTASIPGLEAPDAHTLVIRLSQPQGDFGARLADPKAAPIPPDPDRPGAPFGVADGADDGYGRFLVSTGPYMFQGSDALDFSVPATERPTVAGLSPGRITLIRNPSWDPSTDDLRAANVDRIELVTVETMDAAIGALDGGDADVLYNARTPPQVPPEVFAAFQATPGRGHLYANPVGAVRGMILNLAVPPFDDIHVRKALNLLVDKQALVDLQGGPAASEVFGHIAPDHVEDGLLRGYDPYAGASGRGDPVAAAKEMALSRYDADRDGRCDAVACRHIRATTRDAFAATANAARDQFAALGLGLDVEVLPLEKFFESYGVATSHVGIYLGIGFFSGYIGAQAFFVPFDGRLSINPDSQNGTLVGATPEQLKGWGYTVTETPNVDTRVEACIPLVGAAAFRCWAALDQYLTEQVVPWVPYSVDRWTTITSNRVIGYSFDELAQSIALDQLALQP